MLLAASSDWRTLLAQSFTAPDAWRRFFPRSDEALEEIAVKYPMRINPYYAGLIRSHGDPIWRQAVPDPIELEDAVGQEDPLAEEEQSVVDNLIHRYPNRVVFLVSDRCAVYCRHCMRKRRVGTGRRITAESLSQGIDYIAANRCVDDVILSGGDPLLLEDYILFDILNRLRKISHVKIIRIHSRIPCTLPQRITSQLVRGLAGFHPLWFNTQFNHPSEITPQAERACLRLVDAGIPVGNQSVLLKNVNDSAETLALLLGRLLQIRVRPYYLHHPDRIKGTRHFWVSPLKGLEIMANLRGRISGLAMPQYMIDLPGGGGKVALLPEMVVERNSSFWRIRNFEGRIFKYPLEEE